MSFIKPNKQFVVAKPDEVEKQSSSGLLLGEQARDIPKTAVITSVGEDVTNFRQGDKIIYKDYTTTDIKLGDVEYIVLEHIDIIGTIEQE